MLLIHDTLLHTLDVMVVLVVEPEEHVPSKWQIESSKIFLDHQKEHLQNKSFSAYDR